jgi:hypothetical protein
MSKMENLPMKLNYIRIKKIAKLLTNAERHESQKDWDAAYKEHTRGVAKIVRMYVNARVPE